MKHNKKKIKNIVSGGAGFIGSYIIDVLLENKEEVVCIDNLSSGQKLNIDKWLGNPNFRFINHDIKNSIKFNADKIWHLASPASPSKYQQDPIETTKTIFLGTYNLLEMAKKNNCKFFFASTSEIYGDSETFPQSENYSGNVNTRSIRSCYQEGKRVAETLCFDYHRVHSTDIRVVRIFNTYGPRMNPFDGRVVSNFIVQALMGKDLTVYGSGNQTRTFCFINDLIDGIFKVMNSDHIGPINLGSPVEITIKDLAHLIRRKVNPNLKIKYMGIPSEDPRRRIPLLKIANEKVKWFPSTSLSLGLDKTIDYYKKII